LQLTENQDQEASRSKGRIPTHNKSRSRRLAEKVRQAEIVVGGSLQKKKTFWEIRFQKRKGNCLPKYNRANKSEQAKKKKHEKQDEHAKRSELVNRQICGGGNEPPIAAPPHPPLAQKPIGRADKDATRKNTKQQ